MANRSQILDLFRPVLARIDLGILFAEPNGRVLGCNEAARQILRLETGSEAGTLSAIAGIDLLERIEAAAGGAEGPTPDGGVCLNATQFELQLGPPLEEPRYVQVRTGLVELPCENGLLRLVMLRDITHVKHLTAVAASRDQATLLTRDPQMLDLLGRIRTIAPTEASVLLQGESGTGKTVLARTIHAQSHRAQCPFVEVNCASIPASLIESELFGHVRGAFTGASQARLGRFRSADGGTLFLDEINDLPLELQPKLLRVLQSGQLEAVGSDRTTSVNVRVITASNQNLRPLVDHGLFRADLYYRIAVIPLQIAPLRERPADIKLLAEHFLAELAARDGTPPLRLSDRALHLLLDYGWPGNVRELSNAVEHGVICARNGVIEPEDLPFDIRRSVSPLAQAGGPREDDERQRQAIEEAMRQAMGNRTLAARLLEVDRSTLWRRMRRLGLT
jgi:transcriptional regulator with PAS, ATPase and Fis domain